MLSPRATSTKTRIETRKLSIGYSCGCCPRATSTKTRIETINAITHSSSYYTVRGRLPRKQGLKHHFKSPLTIALQGPRATSTKTRIETRLSGLSGEVGGVRGRLPRKQGLKLIPLRLEPLALNRPRATSTKTRIETYRSSDGWPIHCRPRATSTKTRIETNLGGYAETTHEVRGRLPRKQGLKQSLPSCPNSLCDGSEGDFHENKD